MPGGPGREQMPFAMRAVVTLLLAFAALCGVAPRVLAQTAPTHIAATLVAERGVAAAGQTILLAVTITTFAT